MTLDVAARHRLGDFTLDIAFTAGPGVTALFGPSGCGKTSTLNIVAGLQTPSFGHVRLDELTLLETARHIDLPAERRRCGVVFQDARLFPHLSVGANLRFGARRVPASHSGPSFDDVVDLLGLRPLLPRRPKTLSGGERQRVAIGRALLSRPRLLLMDEPLASLDQPRRAEILPFLVTLRARFSIPILYVTHALDEVDRLADTLVLIESGRVLAQGPVDALMARTDLPLLSQRRDAGIVVTCTVAAHDDGRGLSRLEFPGGALQASLRLEPVGAPLRVRIRARDVTIATRHPEQISSRNVLPATVTALDEADRHEVFVSLAIGPTLIYARVTRDSAASLALAPGQQVFAIVKSTMLAP